MRVWIQECKVALCVWPWYSCRGWLGVKRHLSSFCCRLLCESGFLLSASMWEWILSFWFEVDQWEYCLLLDESRCQFLVWGWSVRILSASGDADVLSFWIEGDQSCVTVKLVCFCSFNIRFLPLWVTLIRVLQNSQKAQKNAVTHSLNLQSSRAVWKSRWPSWAPIPW